MSEPARGAGLLTSIQRLMATAIEMVHVRLELLGTEVEFEKRRLFDGLLFGGVALLLLGMGLILLCGFIVLMFAEGYRLAAVGVMALLFLGGGHSQCAKPACACATPKACLRQASRNWPKTMPA